MLFELPKQSVEDLDQHVGEGVALKIFTVEINRLNGWVKEASGVVKDEGLSATAAGKDSVVLARTDISENVANVYIGELISAIALNAEILRDELTEPR